MSQIKLGSKWEAKNNQDQDLGGIHLYIKSKEGANSMSKITKTAMSDENQDHEVDNSDLESIINEHYQENQTQEVSMDNNSAVIAVMSLLEYSSSTKIDQAFNMVADIYKLPMDSRKIDRDSKVEWINDQTDKLQPKDLMSVYKILSA